jgi:predicted nucleic acid-binding protein
MKDEEERELESLRQEVEQLKAEKAAFEVQQKLLENLVEVERYPNKNEILQDSLQATLDLVTALTNAEKGSLFSALRL